MTFVTKENITEQVLEVFERTPEPRLREVMQSLVKHLHAFIREVEPSDTEFEQGCEFLVSLGFETRGGRRFVHWKTHEGSFGCLLTEASAGL